MKINPMMLGALPGAALAAAGGYQAISSSLAASKLSGNDLVNAKRTAKKYAPDVYVATSKEDVLRSGLSKEHKKLLNDNYSFKNNAAYFDSGDKSIILSPKMVNKSLLGHEMGHHLSPKPSLVDRILRSRDELRAWNASPIKVDEETKKKMLGSSRGTDKIMIGGGLAATGMLIAPALLKRLKK